MNIRLQQFADQANEYANSVHIQWLGPEEMNPKWMPCRDKKFAEFVVRECADLFDPDLTVEHEERIVRMSILNHFGVKE